MPPGRLDIIGDPRGVGRGERGGLAQPQTSTGSPPSVQDGGGPCPSPPMGKGEAWAAWATRAMELGRRQQPGLAPGPGPCMPEPSLGEGC